MLELNSEQLRILRHMLGIDEPSARTPKPYRDYYCANPGDERLQELERLGAVERYECACPGRYEWFTTTSEGRLAALRSHRSIRYSRSRRIYLAFIRVSDCFPDLTFRDFLTDPQFAETRANA